MYSRSNLSVNRTDSKGRNMIPRVVPSAINVQNAYLVLNPNVFNENIYNILKYSIKDEALVLKMLEYINFSSYKSMINTQIRPINIVSVKQFVDFVEYHKNSQDPNWINKKLNLHETVLDSINRQISNIFN